MQDKGRESDVLTLQGIRGRTVNPILDAYHVLDCASELDGARFLGVTAYGAGQGDDPITRVYVDLQATIGGRQCARVE